MFLEISKSNTSTLFSIAAAELQGEYCGNNVNINIIRKSTY